MRFNCLILFLWLYSTTIAGQTTKQDSLNLLGIEYYLNGNYSSALTTFREELKIRVENKSIPELGLAQNYYLIGISNELTGQNQAAIDSLEAALNLYRLLDNKKGQQKCYHRLGIQFQNKEDLNLAEKYLKRAFSLTASLNSKKKYANICRDLGVLYNKKKEYKKAVTFLEKGLKGYKEIDNSGGVYECYNSLGYNYDEQGQYQKAIATYFKAKNTIENQDSIKLAKLEENIGLAYKNLRVADSAEMWLTNALKILEKKHLEKKHVDFNSCYHNLGSFYLSKRQYEASLQYFQKAIINNIGEFNANSIYENPSEGFVFEQHLRSLLEDYKYKGNAFYQWYKQTDNSTYLDGAYQSYIVFGRLMQKMQEEFISEGAQLFWLKEYYPAIESALEVAYTGYSDTKEDKYLDFIFKLIEQNKAIVLLENLKKNKVFETINTDGYQKILTQIEVNKTALLSADLESVVFKDSLGKVINELEIKKESLKTQLGKNLPITSREISLSIVQNKLLTKETGILCYFSGDSSIYLIAASTNNKEVYRFPKGKLNKLVQDVREAIQVPPASTEQSQLMFRRYSNGATTIFKNFVEMALTDFPSTVKNLIILPDGELYDLPFEVLLSRAPTQKETWTSSLMPYLLNKYSTTYGYSTSILLEYQSGNKKPKSDAKLIAFAPSFSGLDSTQNLRVCTQNPTDLSYNKEEANIIVDLFDGEVYEESHANKTNFRKALKEASILHLATHACINEDNSSENRIYLSDSPVFMHELYGLKTDVEMVVLSACETGLGELRRGEGTLSLSRAFSYAGVPSSTMSLWSVNDQSTKDIMHYYYQNLSEGKSKNIALANAKQLFFEEVENKRYYHPFYWAPFVHYGKISAIKTSFSVWNYIGLILFSILIIIFFFGKDKTRSN